MPPEIVQFGRYQLVKKIATGGMAEIFLAKQQGPGRFVRSLVIKRILPHLAEDPKFVAMFLDEASLAAQLSHPHIAQVYDFGEEDGHYYIALELVKGPDLRTLMRVARKMGTPPPVELSVRIMTQVLAALDYAHHALNDKGEPLNVVHRDVSPQNILVSYDGVVKLVDFGIAKASSASSETEAGVVKGKYAYLAPEQLQGVRLDGRCDLYAASLVLYELLTLVTAIQGEGPQAIANAMEAKITPITKLRNDLPMNLVAVLAKATQRDREKRYVDCRQFQGELDGLLVEWGVSAPPHEIADYLKSLEVDGGEVLAAGAETGSFGGVKASRPRAGSSPDLAALGRKAAAQAPVAADPEAANATLIRAKAIDIQVPGEEPEAPKQPVGRQRTSAAVASLEKPPASQRRSGIHQAIAPSADATVPPGTAPAKDITLPPVAGIAPTGDATIAPSFARNILRSVVDDDDENTHVPNKSVPSPFEAPPHVEPAPPEPTARPAEEVTGDEHAPVGEPAQEAEHGAEEAAKGEEPGEESSEPPEDTGEPEAEQPAPYQDAAEADSEATGPSHPADDALVAPKKSKLGLILGGVGVLAAIGVGVAVMTNKSPLANTANTGAVAIKPAEPSAETKPPETKPPDSKPVETVAATPPPTTPTTPATAPAAVPGAPAPTGAVAATPPVATPPTSEATAPAGSTGALAAAPPTGNSKPVVAEAKPVEAKPAETKAADEAKPATEAKPEHAEKAEKVAKVDQAAEPVATAHESRHSRQAKADDPGKQATLSVASSPWAEVILDGRDLGPTPQLNLTVPAGKHTLNLVNKGMGIFRQVPLTLASGDNHKEIAKFEKGKVLFLVKPYANVTFAGKALGQTPLPPQDAYEGKYSADFTNPQTNHTVTKKFEVVAGQQTEVRVDMTKD